MSGNYHEYSFGPAFSPKGDMIVTLNLAWVGYGDSFVKWRGWMLNIAPNGTMTPIAAGFRSPSSFGYNLAGDLFYSENQGDWVASRAAVPALAIFRGSLRALAGMCRRKLRALSTGAGECDEATRSD